MIEFPILLPDLNEKITHNYKGIRYSLEYAENVQNSAPHRHNFLEFTYVTKGVGTETINGIEHPMIPGTFTVLLPYHVHWLESNPIEPLSFYLGSIDLEAFFGPSKNNLGLNDLLFDSNDSLAPYVHLKEKCFSKMNYLFEDIYYEFMSDLQWSDLNIISKLTETMIIFDRNRRSSVIYEKRPSHKYQNNRFWEIIYYVHSNYMNDISLKSLEEHFHINSFYISKLFKDNLGINFVDFLHDIRIRHSCSLLTSTEMPITEIAMEVGYNSHVTFTRAFFQRKGVNAAGYRKLKLKLDK